MILPGISQRKAAYKTDIAARFLELPATLEPRAWHWALNTGPELRTADLAPRGPRASGFQTSKSLDLELSSFWKPQAASRWLSYNHGPSSVHAVSKRTAYGKLVRCKIFFPVKAGAGTMVKKLHRELQEAVKTNYLRLPIYLFVRKRGHCRS